MFVLLYTLQKKKVASVVNPEWTLWFSERRWEKIGHDKFDGDHYIKGPFFSWFQKKYFYMLLGFVFLSIVTPSAKDTAILVGASYAIDLAKSPEGQKIQTLIRKKANDFLDEALEGKEAK